MIHRDLFTIDRRHVFADPDEPLMQVEKMILILEDRRFFRHNGVDLKSWLRDWRAYSQSNRMVAPAQSTCNS
jgi:membrane carboxypeptidase/penicillin-binding protein PbpC